ncbi:hypothetical protein, partial [Burkholderia ubonensis]
VRNDAGIAGRVLGDASGVAIVEAPYDLTANRASIVNADGSLRARLPAAIGVERMGVLRRDRGEWFDCVSG